MEIAKNSSHQVTIESITSEGADVARLDGYTVFVPDTAAGDVCRIKLVKCNKSYGFGKLEEIIVPSPDRQDVDCPVFVSCGGCCYRHITYEAELKIKENTVRDAFRRLAGIEAPVREILGSGKQEGYRNKAQYPVGKNAAGEIVSGFYAKRSHRIIDGRSCRLQPRVFGEIQCGILNFVRQNKIPIYEEATNQGLLRHIYLREGISAGEIMVCLVVTSFRFPKIEELVQVLTGRFPRIKSIVLNRNSKSTNVILGEECRTVYGTDTISDVLCGVKIELSPLSFYQVNKEQAEVLYRKALSYAQLQGEEVLLDLYCGAGTIGLSAAGMVRELIGVEIVPEAVENARRNADANGITNARFLCADAGTAARQLAEEGTRPNVIIVDPPRKGLDGEVIGAIVQMAPQRVVMVSCNPSTAARDAALLEKEGYAVSEITPVDLFPRTAHVETVVLMSRQDTR